MTKIKMCGLRRTEDIEFSNMVKPDYIGYVFAEKSKRYITPEKAAELENIMNNKFGGIDINFVKGNQPVYYYIISVEAS